MDRSQAKSAPPRLKSKFVKNRTNAMKEIQAWVRKDEEFSVPEASRMSGQLSDNVTEERMLKAKLWELSKERYKFLSQNSYEKKMFQDRQQRKANNRRVVSASADGRSRHSSDDARRERRSSVGDMPQKPARVRNARLALLDRLDPTKKRGRDKKPTPDATTSGRQTPSRQYSRANSSNAMLKRQDSKLSVKLGAITTKDSTLPPTHPGRTGGTSKTTLPPTPVATASKQDETPRDSLSSPKRPGDSLASPKRPASSVKSNTFSKTTAPVPTESSSNPSSSVPSPGPATGAQGSWSKATPGQSSRKYGMPVESKVSDPRYAGLEKRLSPLIASNTSSDVSSIVNTIESLHVRPKRRPIDSNRSRTKIEVKALAFIKEKGFVF